MVRPLPPTEPKKVSDLINREGEGLRVMDYKELEAEKKWDSLTFSQKVGDWSYRHQYSLIMGSWAGSLALAGAIISRQKYVSCLLYTLDRVC